MMNVIEISSFGGPEVLRRAERSVPVPSTGKVLIKVSASGVNRPDALQRAGLYAAPPGTTDIPGLDIAGTIVSGDMHAMSHAGFSVGDKVCALVEGGGYAEYCIARVTQCLPYPNDFNDIQAGSLPESIFTVFHNLFERGQLKKGETVLIHGGGSGIGVMAIQMAKAIGAKVIATAGSDEKCKASLTLGADHAINYTQQDFEAESLRITAGRGVDVVLDIVAGDYVPKELRCMADDGRLVIIAVQGGTTSEINSFLMMRKRLTITGSTMRGRSQEFKAHIASSCITQVWPFLDNGVIKPVIHSTFPALDPSDPTGSGAARAHTLMESNQHIGKIVLTW